MNKRDNEWVISCLVGIVLDCIIALGYKMALP
jgi:hypothetical protein